MAYLDNWLIWAEECKKFTRMAVRVIMKQGFLVNKTKSHMIPNYHFEWLGVTWDMLSVLLSILADKRKRIKKDPREFLRAPCISRRQLERVLDSLQFSSPIDPVGNATLKDINHHLLQYVRPSHQDMLCPSWVSLLEVLAWFSPFHPPSASGTSYLTPLRRVGVSHRTRAISCRWSGLVLWSKLIST